MDIQQFADNNRFRTRIDDDGTKIIPGRYGHIYEHGDNLFGVTVMPKPPRKAYWGLTKKILGAVGFQIVKDGDGEGSATFNPEDETQVKTARRAAGIKKRRIASPLVLEQLARIRPTPRRVAPSAAGSDDRPEHKDSGQGGKSGAE